MGRTGPARYGSSVEEAEILQLIDHYRKRFTGKKRRMTFREISDSLNARGLFPRHALKWTPVLVWHAFRGNKQANFNLGNEGRRAR